MTQQLVELVEQFGNVLRKWRGKSDRGLRIYRCLHDDPAAAAQAGRGLCEEQAG